MNDMNAKYSHADTIPDEDDVAVLYHAPISAYNIDYVRCFDTVKSSDPLHSHLTEAIDGTESMITQFIQNAGYSLADS